MPRRAYMWAYVFAPGLPTTAPLPTYLWQTAENLRSRIFYVVVLLSAATWASPSVSWQTACLVLACGPAAAQWWIMCRVRMR